MKNRLAYFALLALITMLTSCADNMQLTKRHYRSGYYSDKGKKQSVDVGSTSNSIHSDFVIPEKTEKKIDLKIDSTNSIIAKKKNKTLFLPSSKAGGIKSSGQEKIKQLKLLRKRKIENAPIDENQDELKKSNVAFILALLATFLFFLGIALLFSNVMILGIALIVFAIPAFTLATIGFAIAQKITRNHKAKKHEKYPGKWQAIFAKTIGIIGFVLVGIPLFFILNFLVQ